MQQNVKTYKHYTRKEMCLSTRRIWCRSSCCWGWRRKRGGILKWYSARASNEDLTTRKMTKKCREEKVIEVIFLWLKQQRQKILTITGPLLFHKVFSERESDLTGNKLTD
jgi:hypothetical protein